MVNVLRPSIGVGGACLTKDPWLAWHAGARHGITLETIETARRVNSAMPGHAAAEIIAALASLGKETGRCTVAILGVSFKNDSGDLRCTPVRGVVDALTASGVGVRLHDCMAAPYSVHEVFGMTLSPDVASAVDGADCVAMLAAHREYRDLTAEFFADRVAHPCLIYDGRRYFSRDEISELQAHGLHYRGVGRQ